MKKYALEFVKRGALFAGLGPIIAGIVYFSVDMSTEGFVLGGGEVLLAIVSTYILAFIQAGAGVFYQIEEWSFGKSMLFHFLSIYVSYTGCYLVNSWIPFKPTVVAVFSLAFAAMYIVVLCIVVFSVKLTSKRLNEKLKH